MREVIYVVAESAAGPCKIGVAADMRQRLGAIQNGNPRKLTIEYAAPIYWPHRFTIERIVHALVGERYRLVGEWFDVSPAQALGAIDRARDMIVDPDVLETILPSEPAPPKCDAATPVKPAFPLVSDAPPV